ncbi:hypothetical protein [Streptomyces niveus]|uniref:hypothetical protein n=1 Tax=Streptomyces niveus TaxID=193462 RepID=UPI0036D268FE
MDLPSPTEDKADDEAPAETQFRVRDVFQFRRTPQDDTVVETEEDAESQAPPMPIESPAIPAPAARVGRSGDGHHVPNWWDPKKDLVFDDGPKEIAVKKAAVGEPCEHPNPHAVHARPTGKLVAYWCEECETQLGVPDDFDELDELDEDDDEDAEGEGGDEVPAKIRHGWGLRGNGKKAYARPRYSKPVEKKSLIEWWTGRDMASRWLLYNGAALAAGFALGVPQFFTAEVAYLVATYDSWTAFYVAIWYGVAAGVWVWDYRSRTWFPPFALAARIPLISMIVGSLLYGSTSL